MKSEKPFVIFRAFIDWSIIILGTEENKEACYQIWCNHKRASIQMHHSLNVMVIVTHVGVRQSDLIPRDVPYQGQCLINPLKAVFLIHSANSPNTFDTRNGKSNKTSKKASYDAQRNHISFPSAVYDVFKPYGLVLLLEVSHFKHQLGSIKYHTAATSDISFTLLSLFELLLYGPQKWAHRKQEFIAVEYWD